MELIKIFMGILLVICLILNINFKAIRDFYEEQNTLHESIEASSPFGLYVKDYKGKVKIVDVLKYTPAMNAGLEPGDRILKVNETHVKDVKAFFEAMESVRIERPVKLLVYRVDSCSTFSVEIRPFERICK